MISASIKYFEATCCVLGCSSSPLTGQTFHLFPPYQEKSTVPFKDESGEVTFVSRREAWMMLLNMNNISFRTRVCSRHFEDSEFQKTRRPSSSRTIINKNMLRTCALPTLHLPKPVQSGERHYIVKEFEKLKLTSAPKAKKIILGVTAYVCCVPDCLHSSITDDCKLFVIPANPKTAKSAWNEFTCKMKQHISKGSRVCSCHFFDDKLEGGPVFYPSDLMDALGLTLEEKKQYIYKLIPSSFGSWDLVTENFYKNFVRFDDKDVENLKSVESSRDSSPSSEISKDEPEIPTNFSVPCRVALLKADPESFTRYSGFKSLELYKTFLSVFDKDYIDVLTERTGILTFEDQILLTLVKLRHNFSFSHLGKEFHISSGDAKGIFERCTAVLENALCDGVLDVGKWESRKTFWQELPKCSLVFFPVEVSLEIERSSDSFSESSKNKVNKMKSLLSVTPAGLVTYVGPFFPDSLSTEEIINRSKLGSVAEPNDIIFLNDKNAVQVKGVKDSHLVLTPTTFSSDSQIHDYILRHVADITLNILNYKIANFISTEISHLSLRIWRIVCAINNFNTFDPDELALFYLNSQKYDDDLINEDLSHTFIRLIPEL